MSRVERQDLVAMAGEWPVALIELLHWRGDELFLAGLLLAQLQRVGQRWTWTALGVTREPTPLRKRYARVDCESTIRMKLLNRRFARSAS